MVKLLRSRFLLLISLTSAVIAIFFSEVDERPSKTTPSDVLCGYRSALFIANYYGQELELIDVVSAIDQRGELEPISLEDIGNYLRSRGIGAKEIALPFGYLPALPYPAVAHLGASMKADHVGHFVVCLDYSVESGRIEIYNGLSGVEKGAASGLSSLSSGAYLLTAPTQSLLPENYIGTADWRWLDLLGKPALAFALLFCLALFLL